MPLSALLIALGALAARSEEQGAVVKREARVVFLDAKGAPVTDLTGDDVAVTEGGVVRAATLVHEDDAAHVALVVDSSQPVATSFRLQFLDAVRTFLSSLPDGTRVTVWTTGDRPRKTTESRAVGPEATREAIDALRRTPPVGGNTVLDAVVEAAEDLRPSEGTRRAVVFLSADGAGFASRDRDRVVEQGLETGAVFAGVLVGADAPGGGELSRVDYDHALGNLTRRSGGRYETPLTAMSASAALERVGRDLRSGYRIAWDSTATAKGRVEVQVARDRVRPRLSDPRVVGAK